MKAAVLTAERAVQVTEVPAPRAEGESALVRIKAAGVCGTDLHILDGMLAPERYPFILGHECAGVVESAPPGSGIEPGGRVVVYNFLDCGRCRYCRTGWEELCEQPQGQIGFNRDGGFAEVVAAPVQNLIPLPASVSYETAALLACSGMSAVHAVRLAGLRLGETAVVNGIGGVGLMVLQVARLAGAATIAVGDSEEKLQLARESGATQTVLMAEGDGYERLPERVREVSEGRGADYYFELVGTEATMAAGIKSLAKGGTFVSIGYTTEDLRISPVEFILGELRLCASVAAAKRDLETAIQLAADDRLRATIDTRYPLAEIHTALERLRARQVKGRNVIVFE